MGGLRRAMPFTASTWVSAWLAMAGIPPLVGVLREGPGSSPRRRWTGGGPVGASRCSPRSLTARVHDARDVTGVLRRPPLRARAARARRDDARSDGVLGVAAAFGGLLGLSEANGRSCRFLEPVVGPVAERRAAVRAALAEHRGGRGPVGHRCSPGSSTARAGSTGWRCASGSRGAQARCSGTGSTSTTCTARCSASRARLGATFLAYVVDRRLIDGFWNGVAEAVRPLSSARAPGAGTGWSGVYAAFVFLVGVVGVLAYLAVRASS